MPLSRRCQIDLKKKAMARRLLFGAIFSRSLLDEIGHQLSRELGLPGNGTGNVAGAGKSLACKRSILFYDPFIDIVVFIYVPAVSPYISFHLQLNSLDGEEHLTGFGESSAVVRWEPEPSLCGLFFDQA